MPISESEKIKSKGNNLYLRVSRGHFATSHSHINYYIDVTASKSRLSEAKAIAEHILHFYSSSTIVDTILCLDGTEVIGTCLATALTRADFTNMNAHQTIYVLTPEHTSGSQLIFRDNTATMIQNKHVLVLAASVTTGYTAEAAVEAVRYYGGNVVGIASIFASMDECCGFPVASVFDLNDIKDYASFSSHDCPMCKRGEKIDALINNYGISII